MLRSLGFDHVIDYAREDFTKSGRRYDLILDVKTTRSVFDYLRAPTPRRNLCHSRGSHRSDPSSSALGTWIALIEKKKVRLVFLKPNKDLAYMAELFEAGKVKPVIEAVRARRSTSRPCGISVREGTRAK